MPDDTNQRAVHTFFVERFNSQRPFAKAEVQRVTDWTESSFNTYWSKQFRAFVVPAPGGRFRVSERFRSFVTWDLFQKHVTQVREGATAYSSLRYNNVLVFEFFMPLTNEGPLRQSLDALFYKETITRRLRSVGVTALASRVPKDTGESDDEYLERLCGWISGRISGYSISHVAGRFRADRLLTFQEAAEVRAQGGRYLIDETTAIVRFIFRCGSARTTPAPLRPQHFYTYDEEDAPEDPEAKREANIIRWLFGILFVQSIVEVVGGEDEIWMVETGMRNCLHIWRVES